MTNTTISSAKISASNAPRFLTTAEFAAELRQSPLTVRKNLCEKGHHFGAKPIKLENRRLLWKTEDLEAILSKGHA